MTQLHPITVYTTPGCTQCRMTKRFLDQRGVTYRAVDLTESPGDLEAVLALGYKTAPVICAGDEHWHGFRPDLLAEHADLALKGLTA